MGTREALLRICISLVLTKAYWEKWTPETMTEHEKAFAASDSYVQTVKSHETMFNFAMELYKFIKTKRDLSQREMDDLLENLNILKEVAEENFFTLHEQNFPSGEEIKTQVTDVIDAMLMTYNNYQERLGTSGELRRTFSVDSFSSLWSEISDLEEDNEDDNGKYSSNNTKPPKLH